MSKLPNYGNRKIGCSECERASSAPPPTRVNVAELWQSLFIFLDKRRSAGALTPISDRQINFHGKAFIHENDEIFFTPLLKRTTADVPLHRCFDEVKDRCRAHR